MLTKSKSVDSGEDIFSTWMSWSTWDGQAKEKVD